MTTNVIREALNEANQAMLWEVSGEPIPSLMIAARLKIGEALSELDAEAESNSIVVARLKTAELDAEQDMILAPKDLINAVAHCGVNFGYGNFEISCEHIQEARDLILRDAWEKG